MHRFIAALLAVASCASIAQAQSADPTSTSPPLTLEQALSLAGASAPSLRLPRLASGQHKQAARLPATARTRRSSPRPRTLPAAANIAVFEAPRQRQVWHYRSSWVANDRHGSLSQMRLVIERG